MNKLLKSGITATAALLLIGGGIAGGLLLAQAQGTVRPVVVEDTSLTPSAQEPLEPTMQSQPVGEATVMPDSQPGSQQGYGWSGMWGMMNWSNASIPSEYANVTNPLASDSATIAQGQSLYAANCAACHGETGLGDGPGATGLNPSPAPLAFTTHMRPDAYLYYRINEGGGFEPYNSAMPAWKNALEDDEVWAIISYLRSLSGTGMMMGYGGWVNSSNPAGEVVTDTQAQEIAQQVVDSLETDTLVIHSIDLQETAYYVEVYDTSVNTLAFRFYIDQATGAVYPEMGSSIMWHQGAWGNGACCGGWGSTNGDPGYNWTPQQGGMMGGWGHQGMWGGNQPGWQATPVNP